MSHARVAFSTIAISSRCAPISGGDRVVAVLDAVAPLRRRLVAADLRLAPQVLDDRVEHARGRERGAGVVEVGDVLDARRLGARACDVQRHAGLRAAIIRL